MAFLDATLRGASLTRSLSLLRLSGVRTARALASRASPLVLSRNICGARARRWRRRLLDATVNRDDYSHLCMYKRPTSPSWEPDDVMKTRLTFDAHFTKFE